MNNFRLNRPSRRSLAGVRLLALALISYCAAAQPAQIQGTVTDPDGLPVPRAIVVARSRAHPTIQTAATGKNGEYRISNLSPGGYLLEAHTEDRSLTGSASVRLSAGESARLDLELALLQLSSDVVVTASATPLPSEETAKAVSVVTASEIQLRNEYSLVESLRLLPGVRVRQIGGPGAQASISMRGLRTTDTAVLVDGMRMRDASDPQGSALPFYETLVNASSGGVEVIHGSGSSLYGSNAIGGAINLVSPPAGGVPHADVLAEGGGLGFLRGLARASGSALDNRLGWSGGITHINVRDGIFGEQPYRNTTGFGFLRHELAPNLFWTGRLMVADAWSQLRDDPYVPQALAGNLPATGVIQALPVSREGVIRAERQQPFAPANATFLPSTADPDSRNQSRYLNGALGLLHQLTPSVSYRVNYQLVDSRRGFDDGPLGIRFEPEFANRSTFGGRVDTLQARADAVLGRWQIITAGYEYEAERYENVNRDFNPNPARRTLDSTRMNQRSHTVFVQDQIRLFIDDLRLSLSGRAQTFRLSEQPIFSQGQSPYGQRTFSAPPAAYTGDAALSYLLRHSGTKFRAHIGNAYRAPSPFERFGSSFFGGSGSAFGDPALRPERSLGMDAGIDQYVAGSKVKLSATWFYTNLREVVVFDFTGRISPATDPWGRFFGYLNVPGGISRGGEFSASLTPWRASRIVASYTYTNSSPQAGSARHRDLFRAINAPEHMANLLVSQSFARRWNVTLDFSRTGSYYGVLSTPNGSRAFRWGGLAKADVVGSYTLPLSDGVSARLYGKVENLTGQTYFESGFYTPGRWALGGIAVEF